MNSKPAQTVADRIRLLAPNRGDIPKLAEISGIKTRTLDNWANGRGEPQVSDAAKIAAAAGVQLLWLGTGEGPMRGDGVEGAPLAPSQAPMGGDETDYLPLIPDLLEGTIQGIELAVEHRRIPLTPEQKSRVVTTLYGINYRRYLVRAAGGDPVKVDQEFAPETMAPDVAALIRLIGLARGAK